MRKLSLVLIATLATAVPSLAVAGTAHSKPPKPRAELVAKDVSGSISAGKVTASATIKNKGNLEAGRSKTMFRLSTDATASGNDPVLGSVRNGKIKPKKSKKVSKTFAVPASLAGGSYRVIACADSGLKVKERKDTNNCKASKGSITIAPGGSITVSASASAGGAVAASGVAGGTCAATTCTLQPGNSKVTFTPTASAGYRFGAWTGATCTSYTTGAGSAITFINPTTTKACTATFVKQVTISWTVFSLVGPVGGSVSGSASNGTCTASDPLTGAGSCLVDAGVGTVTLTAMAVLPFQGWSGTSCASAANPLTLTNPATDIVCTATFNI